MQSLLDDLGGGGGTIGKGSYLDGQASGLCHLLACNVEVTHVGYLFASYLLVNATRGEDFQINDVACIFHAIDGVEHLDTHAMVEQRRLIVIEANTNDSLFIKNRIKSL